MVKRRNLKWKERHQLAVSVRNNNGSGGEELMPQMEGIFQKSEFTVIEGIKPMEDHLIDLSR